MAVLRDHDSILRGHDVELRTQLLFTPRDTSYDPIMPTLNTRGKIAAAEIAFYAPIAVISLVLIFRYAFRRDAGWFFLFIFSASLYYFVPVRKPYHKTDQLF